MTDENKNRSLNRKFQDFLASYQGKVILNYAYSWGAAIVILGALFKLTHISGANFMLFLGMGAEVLVFFVSAFDRPYKSYKWESVFPSIKISGADYSKKENEADEREAERNSAMAAIGQAQNLQQGVNAPIIIGGGGQPQMGGMVNAPSGMENKNASTTSGTIQGSVPSFVSIAPGASVIPGVEVSPEMEEATKAYLEQLQDMTQALSRFVEQTKSMGQDADQINILNKNLTGINAIYEIQLRNISSQLGTIDHINEQSKKMASQIDELNKVYARMLEAMTVNMRVNSTPNA